MIELCFSIKLFLDICVSEYIYILTAVNWKQTDIFSWFVIVEGEFFFVYSIWTQKLGTVWLTHGLYMAQINEIWIKVTFFHGVLSENLYEVSGARYGVFATSSVVIMSSTMEESPIINSDIETNVTSDLRNLIEDEPGE